MSIGRILAVFLVTSLAACAPSAGDAPSSTTGADEIVTADVAASGDVVVSPDGNTVVFLRRAERGMEAVRVDLSATPPTSQVVKSFGDQGIDLHASPGGKYFDLHDGPWNRHHVFSWDLSVQREIRFAKLVIDPTDRRAVGYRDSGASVDGQFFTDIDAEVTELATGAKLAAKVRFDNGTDEIRGVRFSPDGNELLFPRRRDLLSLDTTTATFSRPFTDIGDAKPILGTYDGQSVVLETGARNTRWGRDLLVLLDRDGTSKTLTTDRRLATEPRNPTPSEPLHCLVAHGDALYAFVSGSTGTTGLAKWTRAGGLTLVRSTITTPPDLSSFAREFACLATAGADGSFVAYTAERPDYTRGLVTVPTQEAGDEHFLTAANATVNGGYMPLERDAADELGAYYARDTGEVTFFDLRHATIVATVHAEQWGETPRLSSGDLLTIEDGGKAIYRTNVNARTRVFQTTESPVTRLLHVGSNRAVVRISDGHVKVITL